MNEARRSNSFGFWSRWIGHRVEKMKGITFKCKHFIETFAKTTNSPWLEIEPTRVGLKPGANSWQSIIESIVSLSPQTSWQNWYRNSAPSSAGGTTRRQGWRIRSRQLFWLRLINTTFVWDLKVARLGKTGCEANVSIRANCFESQILDIYLGCSRSLSLVFRWSVWVLSRSQ